MGQLICHQTLLICLSSEDTDRGGTLLSCEAVVAETCFLLKRSGFDPSLALPFIERGVVQLPFVLQKQIDSATSLFKRYEPLPASLANAALIRLAEINDSPLLLTTDSDFHLYRRHGR